MGKKYEDQEEESRLRRADLGRREGAGDLRVLLSADFVVNAISHSLE